MATKPATKARPAATGGKPAAATKPATTKPAASTNGKSEMVKSDVITVKDIAAKLGRTTKSVRVSIRRIHGGGPVVGKGKRYGWKSWKDPKLVKLMAELTATDSE